MRISDLREGLIKLPQQLLQKMQFDARETLWSMWRECAKLSVAEEDHIKEWELYGEKHGLTFNQDVVNAPFVDFHYTDDGKDILNANPQFPKMDPAAFDIYGGKVPIILRVVFNTDGQFNRPGLTRGAFGTLKGMRPQPTVIIRINAQAHALLGALDSFGMADVKPWWVGEYIDEAMGTVEHELTHYVQYFYLNHVDSRQTQSAYKAGKNSDAFDSAAYITSQVEFDPKIKSAITDFIKHTTGRPSTREFADRIKNFVASSNFRPDGPNASQDDFFWELRKADPTKWRKAVKIFVTNIRNAPKFKDTDYLDNFWMKSFSD